MDYETSSEPKMSTETNCQNCIRCDYDHGDDSVGMEGYILCELDLDGVLNLEDFNFATKCPFFKNKNSDDIFFNS